MPENPARDSEDEHLAEMLSLNNIPASGLGRIDALKILMHASNLNEQLKDYSDNRLKLKALCGIFLAARISDEYRQGCKMCGANLDCKSYIPVFLRPVSLIQ